MTRAEPDDLLRQMLLTEYGESGPYEGYRLLRETAPVLVSASGVVVLSRYADCQAALRNRRLGKADESLGFRLTDVPEDLQRTTLHRFRRTMLFRNPPDHERLRRLVADAFTHRHVEQLRPRIAERIDHLLDAAAERERIDIISEIALPLPVAVIGDLLGVPESDRAAAAPARAVFARAARTRFRHCGNPTSGGCGNAIGRVFLDAVGRSGRIRKMIF